MSFTDDEMKFESALPLELSSTEPTSQKNKKPKSFTRLKKRLPNWEVVYCEKIEDGPDANMEWLATIGIESFRTFRGFGRKKEHAIQEATHQASMALVSKDRSAGREEQSDIDVIQSDEAFIRRLVENTFSSMKEADPSIPNSVLAGIVMSNGPVISGSWVISLATGTKSIRGSQISLEGEAVNDCHAEILARRGLISYLYDQLERFVSNPDESIFELAGNRDHLPLRLKVKPEIGFHLYVSSTPCGDAMVRITSKEKPFCSLQGGALRTKIETIDGTIPVFQKTIQTWGGVRMTLLTMSCSDKIARWNVVGLQGSLLSHLIEPIYLRTVVVMDSFHPGLCRALVDRVGQVEGIPAPFGRSQPIIASSWSPIKRPPSEFIHLGMCWMDGWTNPDVIQYANGRRVDGSVSRLCKKAFFERFALLVAKLPEWILVVEPLVKEDKINYVEVKKAAKGFGEAKEALVSSLDAAGFGHWMKPIEQDNFECSFGIKDVTTD